MTLFDLFRRRPNLDAAATQLYVTLVEQARSIPFYEQGGVPDTVDGRFDLLSLHAFLLMNRLGSEGPEAVALSQAVFDLMFADMDQNLREIGVSDIGVGPKVKKMAQAFYGRVAAYHGGLDGSDAELGDALRRNLFRKIEPTDAQVAAMVAYVRREAQALAGQELDTFFAGQVRFGQPLEVA